MDLTPIFRFVLPALTVFAVGLVGGTRRIGFRWAVFLSVILTPIGGFIVALASGPRPIPLDLGPWTTPNARPATTKRPWFRFGR
ncbi:hypothetical protein [Polyangium sp. y55x31]|uniref:hypothetical protein n=1 Tax=Polyangium sp. y55x31 TaxID=3042688 RepID=UPI0024822A31|nr:hypothetical protein [Polyangium sp. y55x31]MDI1475039.1 hypothetical protein [Polyangium sp. y55x31]